MGQMLQYNCTDFVNISYYFITQSPCKRDIHTSHVVG